MNVCLHKVKDQVSLNFSKHISNNWKILHLWSHRSVILFSAHVVIRRLVTNLAWCKYRIIEHIQNLIDSQYNNGYAVSCGKFVSEVLNNGTSLYILLHIFNLGHHKLHFFIHNSHNTCLIPAAFSKDVCGQVGLVAHLQARPSEIRVKYW